MSSSPGFINRQRVGKDTCLYSAIQIVILILKEHYFEKFIAKTSIASVLRLYISTCICPSTKTKSSQV